MALANLSLFGSAFFTPIVVGKITHTLGWEWTFYLVAIFSGVVVLLVFFLVPETTYSRPAYLNTDMASVSGGPQQYEQGVEASNGDPTNQKYQGHLQDYPMSALTGTGTAQHGQTNEDSNEYAARKDSYLRSLLPFNGRKTHENFFKLLLRPIPLFFHPAVFWVCISPLLLPIATSTDHPPGLSDPRRADWLDGAHRGCPRGHLPRSTAILRRSEDGIHVRRGLRRCPSRLCRLWGVGRLVRSHHDSTQQRDLRAGISNCARHPRHDLWLCGIIWLWNHQQ